MSKPKIVAYGLPWQDLCKRDIDVLVGVEKELEAHVRKEGTIPEFVPVVGSAFIGTHAGIIAWNVCVRGFRLELYESAPNSGRYIVRESRKRRGIPWAS